MLLGNIDLNEIVKMSEDDLRELLVENNCNKQELRELIYRLRAMANMYKSSYEYEREKNIKLEERVEAFKATIQNI